MQFKSLKPPAELAWNERERKVKEKKKKEKQFLESLKKEWNQLPKLYFVKILQRMPKLCPAIVKAEVGYFDDCTI